jgi:hypothetical protein
MVDQIPKSSEAFPARQTIKLSGLWETGDFVCRCGSFAVPRVTRQVLRNGKRLIAFLTPVGKNSQLMITHQNLILTCAAFQDVQRKHAACIPPNFQKRRDTFYNPSSRQFL